MTSTNADIERCPARSRRCFIHSGDEAFAFTLRTTLPVKRPQPSTAEILTGNVALFASGTMENLWRLQRRTGQGCDFAGHAEHGQAIGTIRREFDSEQIVVQRQHFAHIAADQDIVVQFQQAAVVIGQPQFARGTKHAAAFGAAHCRSLDFQRLIRCRARQSGANQRAGHLHSFDDVGRAADNAERLRNTDIDLANLELVGVGMLVDFKHFTHHYPGKRRRDCPAVFDFKTRHGQQMGKVGRARDSGSTRVRNHFSENCIVAPS